MIRTLFCLFVLSCALHVHAQSPDALGTLAGTSTRAWKVIGTTSAPAAACKAGEGLYTFQAKPAQVVVQECAGGVWKAHTEAITPWNAGGKSGIAFGGVRYEVKSLPAAAPACKGNANCVRLVALPDGKTDATRTIYLTY